MSKVHIHQEFFTYQEAKDYKQRTELLYPRFPYETSLDLFKRDGKWIVSGGRYASAD